MRKTRPLEERLWDKVARIPEGRGCWLWFGSVWGGKYKYGHLNRRGRREGLVSAHRAAYEVTNGPIPEGMVVMHTCDEPLCCNPAHLKIGTWKENTQDSIRKGRFEGSLRNMNQPKTSSAG